jgi:hypothetical protein
MSNLANIPGVNRRVTKITLEFNDGTTMSIDPVQSTGAWALDIKAQRLQQDEFGATIEGPPAWWSLSVEGMGLPEVSNG